MPLHILMAVTTPCQYFGDLEDNGAPLLLLQMKMYGQFLAETAPHHTKPQFAASMTVAWPFAPTYVPNLPQ